MLRRLAIALLAATASAEVCHLYSNTIESPCFEMQKNTSDYAVRLYGSPKAEFFTNAYVPTKVFAEAQNDGFYANFDYISGQNSMGMEIPMTAPVIFRKGNPMGWQVGFFVPSKFETLDQVPEPKNPNITISTLANVKFAVGVFSGFAKETDFAREEAALRATLAKEGVKAVGKGEWASVWAGYDSPFVLFNRHNEVWVQLVN